jgi:hypothetical protein
MFFKADTLEIPDQVFENRVENELRLWHDVGDVQISVRCANLENCTSV